MSPIYQATYQQQAQEEMIEAAMPTNPLDGLTVHNAKPASKKGATYPASPKQIALIEKLMDEKDLTGMEIPALNTLTGGYHGTASMVIDALFNAPYGTVAESDIDLPPAGYYGVAGKRYVIDAPDSGKWAGWLFFKTGSDYHDQVRLGMARPGETYRGKAADAFATITEDPQAAHEEYARITGRCYACNRKLEDPTSVALGIGPVCRAG